MVAWFPSCGICTFLSTLDAKYILWIFCPGHHSRKSCCVVGFELNQDVVFLKICPFLRSSEIGAVGGWCLCDCWCPSFYSWTIRLRPMFWRSNKLCFCWLLSLSLFKFGWEAKLLWRNFQKPSCLLLGTEGNLLSFLGNLKENALSLQVWVQLVVASFWLGFFIMSSELLVIHFILHYFMHTEQTKVNVMDQLINQWHCPDTAKNLICSILWLFFFLN